MTSGCAYLINLAGPTRLPNVAIINMKKGPLRAFLSKTTCLNTRESNVQYLGYQGRVADEAHLESLAR